MTSVAPRARHGTGDGITHHGITHHRRVASYDLAFRPAATRGHHRGAPGSAARPAAWSSSSPSPPRSAGPRGGDGRTLARPRPRRGRQYATRRAPHAAIASRDGTLALKADGGLRIDAAMFEAAAAVARRGGGGSSRLRRRPQPLQSTPTEASMEAQRDGGSFDDRRCADARPGHGTVFAPPGDDCAGLRPSGPSARSARSAGSGLLRHRSQHARRVPLRHLPRLTMQPRLCLASGLLVRKGRSRD